MFAKISMWWWEMWCVPVSDPRPRLPASHWSHCSSRARLSQKHCKNFSNLKPCKFSSRLSRQPRGGGGWNSGGVIAKYLRNVPRLRPSTSISGHFSRKWRRLQGSSKLLPHKILPQAFCFYSAPICNRKDTWIIDCGARNPLKTVES